MRQEQARRADFLPNSFFGSECEIQFEQKNEQIGILMHAVDGAESGVESRVGVVQGRVGTRRY